MTAAMAGVLIRLAGADPRRVVGLARALDREAAGQRRWRHAEEGGGLLGPEGGRRLALVMMVLVSGGVAMVVRGLAGASPWLAATVVTTAQFGAVVLLAARDAVPLVLAEEDRRLFGWWPLSERELLLARGVQLLRRVLEVSAAIAILPLVALAGGADNAVAAVAGALVGLLLHALALAAGLTAALQALARLWGRRAARRLVELAGVVLLVVLVHGTGGGARPDGLLAAASGRALLQVPPAWFGAWAALAGGSWPAFAAAAIAAATSLVLVAGGARWLGRARQGEPERPARARVGADWTRPVAAWLGPWLTGREGRALLLLVRAHLRADWRLTGQLLAMPPLLLALLWVRAARQPDQAGAGPAADLVLYIGLLAISFAAVLTFTSDPRSSWLVAGGVLDGRRLLTLHRRLVRALVTWPCLVVAVGLAVWRGGLGWSEAARAAIAALLVAEAGVLMVQGLLPAVPFSRAWRRGEQTASRQLFWLLVLVWPVQIVWQQALQRWPTWGWPISLAFLAILIGALHAALARRILRHGLYGQSPRR